MRNEPPPATETEAGTQRCEFCGLHKGDPRCRAVVYIPRVASKPAINLDTVVSP